jgi:hypothetical protein
MPQIPQKEKEWPARKSRSIIEVLFDDANIVCRSYDGKHWSLLNRLSTFDLQDLLAPHLLLFFLAYRSRTQMMNDILTISFETYVRLRKDNHITKVIDSYLEKKKFLFPHSRSTLVFSNHQGEALSSVYTKRIIKKYINLRFERDWWEFFKDYERELELGNPSASSYHSSSASFPAYSVAANTTPAAIEQVESSPFDGDLENFDGASGVLSSNPLSTTLDEEGIFLTLPLPLILPPFSLRLSLCLSLSLSPPS